MRNYFFGPAEFPEIPRVDVPRNDDFLFSQGPTKGLGKIQFHDYNLAYNTANLSNVNLFRLQTEIFKEFLIASASDATAAEAQAKDIDFLLTMGELFTLVAYGQLIIEYRNLNRHQISDDLLDQIFDVTVRDFSKYALQLYSKPSSTTKQMELCMKMIQRPLPNPERFTAIWNDHVYALKDSYQMND
jgi:acyl-CoA dehydrogenase